MQRLSAPAQGAGTVFLLGLLAQVFPMPWELRVAVSAAGLLGLAYFMVGVVHERFANPGLSFAVAALLAVGSICATKYAYDTLHQGVGTVASSVSNPTPSQATNSASPSAYAFLSIDCRSNTMRSADYGYTFEDMIPEALGKLGLHSPPSFGTISPVNYIKAPSNSYIICVLTNDGPIPAYNVKLWFAYNFKPSHVSESRLVWLNMSLWQKAEITVPDARPNMAITLALFNAMAHNDLWLIPTRSCLTDLPDHPGAECLLRQVDPHVPEQFVDTPLLLEHQNGELRL